MRIVAYDDTAWTPSPEPGVDRKMLERDGGEVARATSIVRYAPGSTFAAHTHDLGEELVVLAGTFADEHGRYPAGTYVRNPPGSRHRPGSPDGCTIFVRLRHFDPRDARRCVIRLDDARAPVTVLHAFGGARTSLVRLAPGATLDLDGAVELFVLDGAMLAGATTCAAWTWLRDARRLHAPTGCVFWLCATAAA